MRDQQNPVPYQRWTEGKNNGSIYQFKQGERQKGSREILKMSWAVVEANRDFFE